MGSTNQTTQDFLRKAEMQQKQIELNLLFKSNMKTFQQFAPPIYEAFKSYQPEELRLSLNPEGYVELVNFKLNKRPVYSENPRNFAKKQMEVFQKRPLISNVNFTKSSPYNDKHFHLDLVNEVLNAYDGNETPEEVNTEEPIGLVIMTGCGLGYQIEELIAKCDIYGLCIFDPHKDSFYASLHTIDWLPIIKHFNQDGRMIKLCIGMTPEKTMTHIKMLTDAIGFHNIIHTFIYRHFKSPEENAFIELYKKEFHLNSVGLGFFDDEKISLAHTTTNMNLGIPLLKIHERRDLDLPVFIIGNGPSLDGLKDFVIENKDNAILMSCGTSLGSLCKMGIKPDYHVEMERTKTMKAWLLKGTNKEFRQDIGILGLNNIHPETFTLFDKKYMAAKANDLGQKLLESEFSNESADILEFCNPTVTNCAMSYAQKLGFKNIFLIGVDLGMVDSESHHARGSVHFDLDKEKLKDNNYRNHNYTVDGNFVPEVKTTTTLDDSRVNFERFIHAHPKLNVYNPNNGAKIKGAKSVRPSDLSRLDVVPGEKDAFKNRFDELFIDTRKQKMEYENIHKKYLKPLYNMKRQLKLTDSLATFTDIFHEQNRVYAVIRHLEKTNPIGAMLMRGSVHTFLGLLTKFCQFRSNANIQSRYNFVKERHNELIEKAFRVIREDAFSPDDTLTYWEK